MSQRVFSVYILASRSRTLYTGVTGDLELRVEQHRRKLVPGFTSRYNITSLVWYEHFPTAAQAIEREKQLEGWLRSRKIALIEELNPTWADLSIGRPPEQPPPVPETKTD